MGEVDSVKVPPGCTLVALPGVSKHGPAWAMFRSVVLAILAGGFRMCKFLFLGDHSQIGARNAACEDAINEGFEWLLFVDDDADFPVETLERLKATGADIACADMWSRNIPSFRTVMRLTGKDSEGKATAVPVSDSIAARKGVEDVDVCGMHCTLIRTSLLVRMREHFKDQPWFWSAKHGEDATFCFNAKEIGASIKCDFGITAGHWGVARMAGSDWSRDARNQPMNIANLEMMKRMKTRNLPKEEGAVK